MNATQIITEVQRLYPAAQDCAWDTKGDAGYFKTTIDGKRRVIPVELRDWWWGFGNPIRGQERSFADVVQDIVKELRK